MEEAEASVVVETASVMELEFVAETEAVVAVAVEMEAAGIVEMQAVAG